MQYYLPGVDVAALSDHAFAIKLQHLLRIRQQEAASTLNEQLKDLLHG